MGLPESLKPIILCADDYGVTPAVSDAIRELVVKRRLSAASCLSSAPGWQEQSAWLKPMREQIDVGLHFNLTLPFGPALPSLKQWITDSLTGRIDQNLVAREFTLQLNQFEQAWGSPPDFIDGHQHVHIFPGIRKQLLRMLLERYSQAQRPWVRRVNPALFGHDAPLKALALRLLATGFAPTARRMGVALTDGFAGLYSLQAEADYPTMMAGWLHRARPGSLLMCHPSTSTEPDPEGIGAARTREFAYLQSREFGALCQQEGVVLSRFRRS